jgi:superfamily II DNA/RNA helicase
MSFSQLNLDPHIAKAIQSCGYTNPTPIQVRCIPDILNGKDLVASAQTGTGKTAAFVLPALHRIGTTKACQKPRVLILTPTRELATQITKATSKYGKFLRFNIASLVGGMPYRQQLRDLSRPVDVIVATPGRLLDHMDNKKIDLSGIEMLILDEADRMLDMGFINDIKDIAKATPNTRQTLLFSATVDDKLSRAINQLLKNPVRIDLSREKLVPVHIKQQLYMTDNAHHKTRILRHLLQNENIFKAIIFSATKINADRLAKDLREQGLAATALHGDLKQSARNRVVEELRRGKVQYVVATDVAARGIDISDITHVINYDIPKFSEDYVHRIGRTGRAGKTGIAISFALPTDMRHLKDIERLTGQSFQRETIVGLEPTQQTRSNSAPAHKGKQRRPSHKANESRRSSENHRSNGQRPNERYKANEDRHPPKKNYRSGDKRQSEGHPSKERPSKGGYRFTEKNRRTREGYPSSEGRHRSSDEDRSKNKNRPKKRSMPPTKRKGFNE